MIRKLSVTNNVIRKTETWEFFDTSRNMGYPYIHDSRTERGFIQKIEGLGPISKNINLISDGTSDSHTIGSVTQDTRNILIYISLPPVSPNSVRDVLNSTLYPLFGIGDQVKLNFTLNEAGNTGIIWTILGIVESIDYEVFSDDMLFVVSILCPDPMFRRLTNTILNWGSQLSNTVTLTDGPIYPKEWRVQGSTTITNLKFNISHTYYGDRPFTFTDSNNGYTNSLRANSPTYINGEPGSRKFVQNNIAYPRFVDASSKWPVLYPGRNTLTISRSSGTVSINRLTYVDVRKGLY